MHPNVPKGFKLVPSIHPLRVHLLHQHNFIHNVYPQGWGKVSVVDFQNLDISCLAADRKNGNSQAFCDLTDHGKKSDFSGRGERLIVDPIIYLKNFTPN